MKIPKYISPSQLSLFESDREQYYINYLVETPPPRMPQTQPMAIGSAFDAYCKSYLALNFFGTVRPQFEFDNIFKSQVEEQHREWALKAGHEVFLTYKSSGALADIMGELRQSLDEPQFEFKVENRLPHARDVEGVPLLGKPDVYFKTKRGRTVIYDWKVNGYFSNSRQSPKKGYIKRRGAFGDKGCHKDAMLIDVDGLVINACHTLDTIDKSWAQQLCIYNILLGGATDFVAGIEQIVCNPNPAGGPPTIEICSIRSHISKDFQEQTIQKLTDMWDIILSGHIFRDLDFEASRAKQMELDRMFENGISAEDQLFRDMVR